MTEEEFKNLKVGDHFMYDVFDGDYYINKVIDIEKDTVTVVQIYTNLLYGSVNGETTEFEKKAGLGQIELLPLYNSPLYLAMNEEE